MVELQVNVTLRISYFYRRRTVNFTVKYRIVLHLVFILFLRSADPIAWWHEQAAATKPSAYFMVFLEVRAASSLPSIFRQYSFSRFAKSSWDRAITSRSLFSLPSWSRCFFFRETFRNTMGEGRNFPTIFTLCSLATAV